MYLIMENLRDKVKYSIRFKLIVLILAVIIFISASLVSFFIIMSKRGLEKEIEKRGIVEVKGLAHDVEYGVLTENKDILSGLVDNVILSSDIIYVEIIGEENKSLSKYVKHGLLFTNSDKSSKLETGEDVCKSLILLNNGNRAYKFTAPIRTKIVTGKAYDDGLHPILISEDKDISNYLTSKIGIAKIAISLEVVDSQISHLLSISIIMVLIVIVISTVPSIYFTNMVVKPIRKVAQAAIDISEGKLMRVVNVKSTDETNILAINFNRMTKSLRKTIYNLKLQILERVEAVKRLQQSENKYRKLIESANDAIFIIDVETGTVIDINKRAVELLGDNEENIIGLEQSKLFPNEKIKKSFNNDLHNNASVKEIPREFSILRNDGTKVPVETSSSVIDMGGKKIIQSAFRDVTDRKKIEKELLSAKEMLQSIIDNTTAVIYIKDLEGRYILINSRHEDLFLITKKEIIGKTDYDIFSKDEADKLRENDKQVINTKSPLKVEEVVSHNDGGLHTYISVKFLLKDEHGAPYGVCGISTDITDRKKAENTLRRLSGQILNAYEEERKRISMELHDGMGQTLLAIKLYIQMMDEKLKKGLAPDRNSFDKIYSHLNKTIDELRNITMDLRPSYLEEMSIGEALSWYSTKVHDDTGIIINLKVDNSIKAAPRIKDHIYRIYQEVLNNVYKHAGADIVNVVLKENKNIMSLEVRDNGKGFDMSDKSQINRRIDNNSLGFSIICERAELLGGKCKITSSIQEGTTIYVEVPL